MDTTKAKTTTNTIKTQEKNNNKNKNSNSATQDDDVKVVVVEAVGSDSGSANENENASANASTSNKGDDRPIPLPIINSNSNSNNNSHVRFGSITVREYCMTLGTNPAASIGAPVCLTWEYRQLPDVTLDEFEITRNFGRLKMNKNNKNGTNNKNNKNRSPSEFYLSYYKREAILLRAGFSKEDFDRAEREVKWERMKRKLSTYESFPRLYIKSWKVGHGRRKSRRFVKKYRRQMRRQQQQQQQQQK